MKEPIIRMANADDAAAIADLSAQLGYPAEADPVAGRLAPLLAADDHAVLVACLPDGPVVGWVHVFLARRLESDVFAELGGFVVDEPHRGRGLGRALLAAAEDWAAALGVAKLRVRTRAERAGAHAFYERLGFELTKRQHVYDKACLPRRP